MSANPFRALCAELVDELENWIVCGDEFEIADAHLLIDRARTLLAQPEPEGPSSRRSRSSARLVGNVRAEDIADLCSLRQRDLLFRLIAEAPVVEALDD